MNMVDIGIVENVEKMFNQRRGIAMEGLKEYPKKIYLQIEGYYGDIVTPEDIFTEGAEVTWSIDRINDSDIVYYRHGNTRKPVEEDDCISYCQEIALLRKEIQELKGEE